MTIHIIYNGISVITWRNLEQQGLSYQSANWLVREAARNGIQPVRTISYTGGMYLEYEVKPQ